MPEELRPDLSGLPKSEQIDNAVPVEQEVSENAIEFAQNSISPESQTIINQTEPVFKSPDGEAVGAVEDPVQELERAEQSHDKKKEHIALEHLLTDGEITGNNAFDAQVAAENLGQ